MTQRNSAPERTIDLGLSLGVSFVIILTATAFFFVTDVYLVWWKVIAILEGILFLALAFIVRWYVRAITIISFAVMFCVLVVVLLLAVFKCTDQLHYVMDYFDNISLILVATVVSAAMIGFVDASVRGIWKSQRRQQKE